MKEQTYVLKNVKSFEPKHIFECGQCFRWNLEKDNSYTGIVGKNVLNVKKEKENIIIKGYGENDIEKLCNSYFDLETDYEKIKAKLSKIDDNMKMSIQYGKGIRILQQDLWETLISFIISANNNIPRIKGIIERISQEYGTEIIWNGKKYYTFPTVKELSKASIQNLRTLGLGFRDKKVYQTTQMVNEKIIELENLKEISNISQLKEMLLKFPGVGSKVADCIMLFSMKKYEVFPIDVWVKRVMTELYHNEIKEELSKINNDAILQIANQKYQNLAGIAQQYLFYWRRTMKK